MLNLILLNTANVLYIFCYAVRDVLWLRILAVTAMVLLLPFYALQDKPMIECMAWQFVFIAINAFWIVVIFRERRPPQMNAEEEQLYESVFKGMCSPQDMLRLIAKADWNQARDGTYLIRHNTDLDKLLLLCDGRVSVRINGDSVATLESGHLMGEMSFLTQNKTVADVISLGPVRYLSWERHVLESLFKSKA